MQFVHEMLTAASLNHPHRVAIVHKDRNCTFSQLETAVTKVAVFLSSRGVMPGDRVGIFSSKGIEEIIVLFAICKIGGVLVHINPHYKAEQLDSLISDCGLKVLFFHDSRANVLNELFPRRGFTMIINLSGVSSIVAYDPLFHLDTLLKEPSPELKVNPGIHPKDPAAIIYTSGSTGNARGVIVTHRILYDATVSSATILDNNADDRLISVTALSFDGALSQLFTAVLAGGTLVLQDSLFPADIVKTMLRERITGFHAVPSFWRIMLKKYSPFARYHYPHLRYVSVIGEVFPREELLKLKAILAETEFYIMYGITEAFRSTYLPPADLAGKSSSIGIPFPGVEILIVDDHSLPCPVGQIGEIVHKGAFVSPGYWNDDEKTARVFKDGACYTGDLGKIDAEGYLYFVGRKDAMIKSMGFRISPGEIEACLIRMGGVREAAVIGIPDEEYGIRIKAFLVPEQGSPVTPKAVIRHCKSRLPHYMVPHLVEFIADLPRTGTLKIAKSQLALQPPHRDSRSTPGIRRPTKPVEQTYSKGSGLPGL